MKELKPVEDLTYEEAFLELEAIVGSLENGNQPLDQAMEIFMRGQALVKRCGELLEKAELKVKQISGDSIDDIEASS